MLSPDLQPGNNAMKKVWRNFHGRNPGLSCSAIIALNEAGIHTHTCDGDSPRGPGLLFFDEITSLCHRIRELSCSGRERVLAVSLCQSSLTSEAIWGLLQSGASDVIAWDESATCVHDIALRLERWLAVDQLLDSALVSTNLIGQSTTWRSVLRQLIEVARFTDASILITGESGTGKELAARLIHTLDNRPKKRDLVVLDCTTVVPALSGSEFFGHERGAFTGAANARDGAFALADGGTLFLDEIGELPLELQGQLLRVIQEKTFKRIGGNNWQKTEFRLVCATNRDLREEVRAGKFRNDLYYRIMAWKCCLPPLRERREDIIPLARHFITSMPPKEDSPELDRSIEEYLVTREYPGNVRDLKQLVTRIMYRHVGNGPITIGNIPEEERPTSDWGPINWCDDSFEAAIRRAVTFGVGLKEIGRTAEDTAIRIAVGASNNLQLAAKMLGVTDRTLQNRRPSKRQNGQQAEIWADGPVDITPVTAAACPAMNRDIPSDMPMGALSMPILSKPESSLPLQSNAANSSRQSAVVPLVTGRAPAL